MTSQIPIVNYDTSANTGQALPSWPSLLHLLPVCLVSVGSECQALPFPSTSIRAGLNTPLLRITPHTRRETRRSLTQQQHWWRTGACHQQGWQVANGSLCAVITILGGIVSCWCSSILSCWHGAGLGFHRHFQLPTAPAARVPRAGLLALLQLCGSH